MPLYAVVLGQICSTGTYWYWWWGGEGRAAKSDQVIKQHGFEFRLTRVLVTAKCRTCSS